MEDDKGLYNLLSINEDVILEIKSKISDVELTNYLGKNYDIKLRKNLLDVMIELYTNRKELPSDFNIEDLIVKVLKTSGNPLTLLSKYEKKLKSKDFWELKSNFI